MTRTPARSPRGSWPRARGSLGLLAVALGVAFGSALACSAHAGLGVPVIRTLPNGLRVAVFRDPRLPLVALQLTVPAGSASERTGESGAAHMVAELVRRGTTSRDPRVFAAEVERLGASLNTSSGRDFAAVTGLFLAGDLERAVELVGDAASHPVFLDAEIEPLRTATGRAVSQQLGNPSAVAEDGAWATVFGPSGYGRPPLGTLAGVGAVTRDAVREFYVRQWRPDRAVLAIAGDVDPERAFHAAQEWLGGWTTATPVPPAIVPPAARPVRIRVINRDVDESVIRIGIEGPRRGDAGDVPLRMLSRVLAGSAGTRLERARLEGAPLRAPRAVFVPLRDAGLFQIGVAAAPESTGAAVRAVLDAIAELGSSPPTEAELAPARLGVASAYALQLETLGQVVTQWSGGALYGLPPDELIRVPARTDSVDSPGAAAAARRWLSADRAVIVVVGPASVLRPQLVPLGEVQVVELQEIAAQEGTPPVPTPAFTADQEKRGREIVRRALQAHGGLARIKGVRTSTIAGAVTLSVDKREVSGTLRQVRKEPYRMQYVTGFEGLTMRQVLDGTRAWSLAPGSGTVLEADSVQLRALRNGFDSDVPHLLLEASSGEVRVGAIGSASVDGRDVETVEVRSASGKRRLLHFEKASHRLAAMDQNEGAAEAGFEARRVYRDYRTVSGLVIPHEEDRLLDGQRVMRLKITQVEINTPVDDASFERPEEPLPPPSR